MNREIKFRVWDGTSMAYVRPLHLLRYADDVSFTDGEIDHGRYVEADAVDLMQFTGLKDKNGVEIYGGDWVPSRYFGIPMEVYWDQGQCGWELRSGDGHVTEHLLDLSRPEDGAFTWEVIGNIHENPDLLITPSTTVTKDETPQTTEVKDISF